MSTTGRDDAATADGESAASVLHEAELVHLVARRDGDAVAAAGVLARHLAATDVAYQLSIGPLGDRSGTTADAVLGLGSATHTVGGASETDARSVDAVLGGPDGVARAAFDLVEQLDGDPAARLALAGCVAADVDPGPIADAAGLAREPGVGVPVPGVADGLAHSTLVHAPFSVEESAVEDLLADLGLDADVTRADLEESEARRLAAAVGLAAAGDDETPSRAAVAVERALHPAVGGPFETVAGHGDVLDALARTRPGLALAVAVTPGESGEPGAQRRDAALSAWREHARAAHEWLAGAEPARHDGLTVATCGDAPPATVARLLADFRAAEPVTLAVGDRGIAIHARDGRDVVDALAAGLPEGTVIDATVDGTRAVVREPAEELLGDRDAPDLATTVREAL